MLGQTNLLKYPGANSKQHSINSATFAAGSAYLFVRNHHQVSLWHHLKYAPGVVNVRPVSADGILLRVEFTSDRTPAACLGSC